MINHDLFKKNRKGVFGAFKYFQNSINIGCFGNICTLQIRIKATTSPLQFHHKNMLNHGHFKNREEAKIFGLRIKERERGFETLVEIHKPLLE